jgi:hypothetical protein
MRDAWTYVHGSSSTHLSPCALPMPAGWRDSQISTCPPRPHVQGPGSTGTCSPPPHPQSTPTGRRLLPLLPRRRSRTDAESASTSVAADSRSVSAPLVGSTSAAAGAGTAALSQRLVDPGRLPMGSETAAPGPVNGACAVAYAPAGLRGPPTKWGPNSTAPNPTPPRRTPDNATGPAAPQIHCTRSTSTHHANPTSRHLPPNFIETPTNPIPLRRNRGPARVPAGAGRRGGLLLRHA